MKNCLAAILVCLGCHAAVANDWRDVNAQAPWAFYADTVFEYSDFCDNPTTSVLMGPYIAITAAGAPVYGNNAYVSGTTCISSITHDATEAGNYQTAGNDGFNLAQGSFRVESVIRITALSDGTDTFTIRTGLMNANSGDPGHGAWCEYSSAINSGEWQCVTDAGGAEVDVDSNVAVAANTWYRIIITYNPQESTPTVRFYIQRIGTDASPVLVGSDSTTITSTNLGIYALAVDRTAGTTSRVAQIDFASFMIRPTASRW